MSETLDERNKRLIKIVDETGFGFQIAAAQVARATRRWGVATEVAWRDDEDAGYADLVLTSSSTVRLVVECKRQFVDWVFLVESERNDDVAHVRGFWTDVAPDKPLIGGWDNLWVDPRTRQSQFCATGTRNQPRADGRLLEPVASILATATQAIGTEQSHPGQSPSFWIPLILTTARLFTVRECSSKAHLATGHVATDDIEEVQLVRFQKSLSTKGDRIARDLTELFRMPMQSERTVLVCQAEYWPTLLQVLDVDLHESRTLPWDRERERMQGRGAVSPPP